jgi:hypothetical protein
LLATSQGAHCRRAVPSEPWNRTVPPTSFPYLRLDICIFAAYSSAFHRFDFSVCCITMRAALAGLSRHSQIPPT